METYYLVVTICNCLICYYILYKADKNFNKYREVTNKYIKYLENKLKDEHKE